MTVLLPFLCGIESVVYRELPLNAPTSITYALAIGVTLIVLAGCTGPVTLRDPQTGKTVQCGPDDTEQSAEVAYQRERDCIEYYQRQGYKRVSH